MAVGEKTLATNKKAVIKHFCSMTTFFNYKFIN